MEWVMIEAVIDKVACFVEAGGEIAMGDDSSMEPFNKDEVKCIENATSRVAARYNAYKTTEHLYGHYETFFQNYLRTKILPAVTDLNGELLLREVAKRWKGYKFIMHWVSFLYIWIDIHLSHPNDTSTRLYNDINSLQNLVYEEMKGHIISTILSLIDEDREGNSVDRALIKEVLETVYDLQSETLSEPYQTDFEAALFKSSCAYCLLKVDDTFNLEYMLQVDEWLNAEKLRTAQYLHPWTASKLFGSLMSTLGILDIELM